MYFMIDTEDFRQEFRTSIDPRTNTAYVQSIHPYDETEYHWARQDRSGEKWSIYRNGRLVSTIEQRMTVEQIASELIKLDKATGLKRTGGIW